METTKAAFGLRGQNVLHQGTCTREVLPEAGDSGISTPERQKAKP